MNNISRYKKAVTDELLKTYQQIKDKKIIIWGTGSYGRSMASFLLDNGFNALAFCESTAAGDERKVLGLPVLSPNAANDKHPDAFVLLCTDAYLQILGFMKQEGINLNVFLPLQLRYVEKQLVYMTDYDDLDFLVGMKFNWIDLYSEYSKKAEFNESRKMLDDLLDDEISRQTIRRRIDFLLNCDFGSNNSIPLTHPQYFDASLFNSGFSDEETYFDLGAYNGDTVLSFIDAVKSKYSKIIAFEPDEGNFNEMNNSMAPRNLKNLILLNKACGKENGRVCFRNRHTDGSHIVDDSSDKIDLCKLDDYFFEKPTFIKMDIEGAELDCLKGAERILRELKPKLAICLYHKPFDIFEIPFYLKKIVPEYTFKIRQHQRSFADLVLYASA